MSASETLREILVLCHEMRNMAQPPHDTEGTTSVMEYGRLGGLIARAIVTLDKDLCAGLALPSEWCALGSDTKPTVREGQLSAERDRLRDALQTIVETHQFGSLNDNEAVHQMADVACAALKGGKP